MPRSTPPPPLPNRKSGPSVSDYPPPTQLFQASSFQPRSAPPPRPRGSQTSASENHASQPGRRRVSVTRAQSPISSQAQNSDTTEPPEAEERHEAPPRPVEQTLSEDQMQVLNALLSQPGRELTCLVLSPTLEPGTMWFGHDKSTLTRRITKKTHTWHPSLTGVVQEKFEKICQLRMKGMVSTCRTSRKRPTWIVDDMWKIMIKHLDTAAAKAKSKKASAARNSDRNGLGPHKHNSGQKSYLQIEQEMVEELGRPVTIGEVFIKTHTKKDGSFVDKKAQKVAEAYQNNKQAKLTDLGNENSETSDGTSHTPQLSIEKDNELFLQSTFTDKRGRHYGIGSLESTLMNGKRKYSASCSSSFFDLQKQLDSAHRMIEKQEALNAKQEKKLAKTQKELKKFSKVDKFLSATDSRYAAFMESNEEDDDDDDEDDDDDDDGEGDGEGYGDGYGEGDEEVDEESDEEAD